MILHALRGPRSFAGNAGASSVRASDNESGTPFAGIEDQKKCVEVNAPSNEKNIAADTPSAE